MLDIFFLFKLKNVVCKYKITKFIVLLNNTKVSKINYFILKKNINKLVNYMIFIIFIKFAIEILVLLKIYLTLHFVSNVILLF